MDLNEDFQSYSGVGTKDSFGNIPNSGNSQMGYQNNVQYPFGQGSY